MNTPSRRIKLQTHSNTNPQIVSYLRGVFFLFPLIDAVSLFFPPSFSRSRPHSNMAQSATAHARRPPNLNLPVRVLSNAFSSYCRITTLKEKRAPPFISTLTSLLFELVGRKLRLGVMLGSCLERLADFYFIFFFYKKRYSLVARDAAVNLLRLSHRIT